MPMLKPAPTFARTDWATGGQRRGFSALLDIYPGDEEPVAYLASRVMLNLGGKANGQLVAYELVEPLQGDGYRIRIRGLGLPVARIVAWFHNEPEITPWVCSQITPNLPSKYYGKPLNLIKS